MTADPRFARLRVETFAALRPPPKLRLSEWAESHVRLPASLSATPGPMRLWPQQREILDLIGDDTTERVSILKSARVGATQAMVAALGVRKYEDVFEAIKAQTPIFVRADVLGGEIPGVVIRLGTPDEIGLTAINATLPADATTTILLPVTKIARPVLKELGAID